MDIFFPEQLMNVLIISMTFSVVLMALVQKTKELNFVNKGTHVWFVNLILAFLIGIPFGFFFFHLKLVDAIWVALFSFVGAPGIYQTLKSQNILNYTPKALTDIEKGIIILKENQIERND